MAAGYRRCLRNTERLVFLLYFLTYSCSNHVTVKRRAAIKITRCSTAFLIGLLFLRQLTCYTIAVPPPGGTTLYYTLDVEPNLTLNTFRLYVHETCFCTKMAGYDSLSHAG